MSIRHEYRVTASSADAHAKAIARSGIPAHDIPDFSAVWYENFRYHADSPMLSFPRHSDSDEPSLTALEAVGKFWSDTASEWPSAKMIRRTVEVTENVIFDNSLPDVAPAEFNESETGL